MAATPKPVRQAFLPASPTIAGIKVRPVTAAHWLWLEELDSPAVRDTTGSGAVKLIDVLVVLHVLSLDPATLLEPPVKADVLRDARALAGNVSLSNLASIGKEVFGHVAASFVTRPSGDEGGRPDEDSPFVTSRRRKAAAGFSTRSPRSAKATAGRSNTP